MSSDVSDLARPHLTSPAVLTGFHRKALRGVGDTPFLSVFARHIEGFQITTKNGFAPVGFELDLDHTRQRVLAFDKL